MTELNPLSRYKIRRKISAGGMATVYLAHDLHLDRAVALKMLHPHLLNNLESIKRFSVEAKAIATLSNENIIQIYDYGESKQRPFIVMEYIEGKTLQEILDENTILPNTVIIALALQILCGIQCAHQNGIYHRDIKPSNILINNAGIVRITDFGIAYLANAESITVTGSFLGSPHFISPEQASGKHLTNTTDIFSFGVLLYLCSTGKLPFTADSPHAIVHAILNNTIDSPSEVNDSVLFWLSELIDTCLIKSGEKRANSATLIKIIQDKCAQDLIETGPVQIQNFLLSPGKFIAEERNLLFQNYRKLAFIDKQSKKSGSALRRVEQAKRFGTFSNEDLRLLTANKKKLFFIGITTCCIAIFCSFFILTPQYKSSLKKVAIQEKGADSIPSTNSIDTSFKEKSITSTNIVPEKHLHENRPAKKIVTSKPIETSVLINSKVPQEQVLTNSTDSGFFSLFTNPPWVDVLIDNENRGTTPRLNTVILPKGNHPLKLKKNGYKNIDTTILIKSDDTLILKIRLEQLPLPSGLQ
jgi:serine/threonine protein kinase